MQFFPGIFLACFVGVGGVAAAQAVDPATAAPSPATAPANVPQTPQVAAPASPPPAHSGTYSVQNGELIVAPGLRIPNGNVPWALDVVEGKQVLVPIHHAAMTPAGELEGAGSKSALRSAAPSFFVHASDRTENAGDTGRSSAAGWALGSVEVAGGNRTLNRAKFGPTVPCGGPVVCVAAESLPQGWLKITPKGPLAAGEYVLFPVARQGQAGPLVVYDFSVSEAAATPKDAVNPGQNLDTGKRKPVKKVR